MCMWPFLHIWSSYYRNHIRQNKILKLNKTLNKIYLLNNNIINSRFCLKIPTRTSVGACYFFISIFQTNNLQANTQEETMESQTTKYKSGIVNTVKK